MTPEPLIIVQARLGSTRLPGKVMREINGIPLLGYLLDRLPDGKVVVATPDQQIADFVARWSDCQAFVWDGPEDDVHGRFAACLARHGNPETFVRLCADSPLLDPELIQAALVLYEPPYLQIHSPVGCVEVANRASWEAWPATGRHRREHVFPLLLRQKRMIEIGISYPRLVVDTPDDFARLERAIGRMTRPHWEYGWRECAALAMEGT